MLRVHFSFFLFLFVLYIFSSITIFAQQMDHLSFDPFGRLVVRDAQGQYIKSPIDTAADRMAVFAMVMNFGEQYKKEEVTSDDY